MERRKNMKQMDIKVVLFCTALSLIAVTAALIGCSKKSAGLQRSTLRMSKVATLDDVSTDAYEAAPMAVNETGSDYSGTGYTGASTKSNLPADRKLIRTGNINIEVTSLADTQTATENWVKQYGGYISDSSEDGRSISFTAHIPSARFDEAMDSSAKIGKVTSKTVNSTDVTDQYYDLDTRLSTRRILLERLQTYLKQAKDMKDMLDIETKINDVTTEIENMQGQLNRLSKQIDYAQIDICAQLPVNQTEQGFVFPDTKSQFREFCGNILNFFSNFLFVLLYIIIYGVPIVLVLFLLYWLCFGKVGLLRKLFKKCSATSTAKVRGPITEQTTVEKK